MDAPYCKIIGKDHLQGEVSISGSKNAALPILVASILTSEPCIIRNVPELTDTLHMLGILRFLGVEVVSLREGCWQLTAKKIHTDVQDPFVRKLRASVCLLGALLGRELQATVPLPGGCRLGERPIDLHLRAFRALGAHVEQNEHSVCVRAKRLRGATFSMSGQRGPSMTGTSNAIMAAVLAEGVTIVQGASREPEIVDLCHFLEQMGAKIVGAGTETIVVTGVNRLHGTEFTVMPDRIEAGTFIILGYLCGASIRILDISQDYVKDNFRGFLDAIPYAKEHLRFENHQLIVRQIEELPGFSVCTGAYPGFPTDLQPQVAVLASRAHGTSTIRDLVFPKRFAYVTELQRFGIHVSQQEGMITIHGPNTFHGGWVAATDLRAGAALYLAGVLANGKTTVSNLEYIDRGYEHFEQKLRHLGAIIERC